MTDSLEAKFSRAMQKHVEQGFDPDLMFEAAMLEVLDDSGQAAGDSGDPRDENPGV
jgi:hypothetical protein